jgi:hypothetical protein
VTLLESVLVYGWLAGMLVIALAVVCMLRYPDEFGLDRLTVTLMRAHPYMFAFLFALVTLTWFVSMPLLKYTAPDDGEGQP